MKNKQPKFKLQGKCIPRSVVRTAVKSILLIFYFGWSTLIQGQNILVVDNNSTVNGVFNSLQTALSASQNGDIIHVQPSPDSYGNISIQKSVTIIGRSHSEPSNQSKIAAISLFASGVTLKGLDINSISLFSGGPITDTVVQDCGFRTLVLGSSSASGTVSNTQISGCLIEGITTIGSNTLNTILSNNFFISQSTEFIRTSSAKNIVFMNNVFRASSTKTNFTLSSSENPIVFTRNMFIANFDQNVNIAFETNGGATRAILTDNLFFNYGTGNIAPIGDFSATGSLLDANPMFTNVDPFSSGSIIGRSSYDPAVRLEDDISLSPGSPALPNQPDEFEIGLLGGGFRYNIFGNPREVPLLDVVSFDTAVNAGSNINVVIKAKAN